MCVCPHVRSRLLAAGSDLAPFLVSLVSPPVAAARYIRAAYGAHDVHITYIGACPSADDPAIDTRLTPDDFFVELSEHGIALSEQPLVFDSIVPPDRRRWTSLPGGIPSADALWTDNESRTLIEIDRDDATTNLAQHIIAREHVLLDLAPGLGCACSGAIGSLPPRSARVAVTSLEPPRALSPVVDANTMVNLDVPVDTPSLGAPRPAALPIADVVAPASAPDPALEQVLDEMLGEDPSIEKSASALSTPDVVTDSDAATVVEIDEPLVIEPAIILEVPAPSDREVEVALHDERELEVEMAALDALAASPPALAIVFPDGAPLQMQTAPPSAGSADPVREPEPQARDAEVASAPALEAPAAETGADVAAPRRRTPPTAHARYAAASIPKATTGDGRPLPRAYVARRRTPPSSAAVSPNASVQQPVEQPTTPEVPEVSDDVVESGGAEPVNEMAPEAAAMPNAEAMASADAAPTVPPPAPNDDSAPATGTVVADEIPPPAAFSLVVVPPTPSEPPSSSSAKAKMDAAMGTDAEAGAGTVAAPAANQGALVFLLVTALVALAAFVLFSLRR